MLQPRLWEEPRKIPRMRDPKRHRLPTAECLGARRSLSRNCGTVPKGTKASGDAEAKASGVNVDPGEP
jgi:hypothetical protein